MRVICAIYEVWCWRTPATESPSTCSAPSTSSRSSIRNTSGFRDGSRQVRTGDEHPIEVDGAIDIAVVHPFESLPDRVRVRLSCGAINRERKCVAGGFGRVINPFVACVASKHLIDVAAERKEWSRQRQRTPAPGNCPRPRPPESTKPGCSRARLRRYCALHQRHAVPALLSAGGAGSRRPRPDHGGPVGSGSGVSGDGSLISSWSAHRHVGLALQPV